MNKCQQIEEIALDLNSIIRFKDNGMVARYATAEAMYDLGYCKQSGWISVKDRLPESFTDVLCFFPENVYGSKIKVDYMESKKGCFAGKLVWGNPTHWMPLPTPPTEKENNNESF